LYIGLLKKLFSFEGEEVMSFINCEFKVGDTVSIVRVRLAEVFKSRETVNSMMKALKGKHEVVEVLNYKCTCQKRVNGNPHANGCMLRYVDSNQVVKIMLDGELQSFSARFFCKKSNTIQ